MRGNMKNICLILVGLTFLSVLPSYATKIIVNDNKDRIVYSRSSRPPKEIITEQYVVNEYSEPQNTNPYTEEEKNSYIYTYSVRNVNYNLAILDLGNDIREELVGTKWYYPEYKVWPVRPEIIDQQLQNPDKKPQNFNEKPQNIVETTYIEDERFKRTSREASDYYIVDIVNAPNTLIPSWVPEQ